MSKGQRLCVGIFLLLLVDVIWVTSAEITEYLFKTEEFRKPYFSTYIKTSMFIIYLFGFFVWKPWRHQCRYVEPQHHTLLPLDGARSDRMSTSALARADVHLGGNLVGGGRTWPVQEQAVDLLAPSSGNSVKHLNYVDPNVDPEEVLCNSNSDTPLSDPLYIPIKFHDGGDKSSGTESDDQGSHLGKEKNVRFSKVTEVRQLADAQAEDAILARLSYTASVRARELAYRLANKLTLHQVAKLALIFTGIWFVGNVSYQEALANTEAGIVNSLSSTSGLFTLILASTFPSNAGDRLTLSKLVAVAISMGGVVLVCLSDMSFEKDVPLGAIWSIVGALFYAIYLVLLRRKVDNEDRMDITMFFGFVGLFCLLTFWPGIVILHYAEVEPLEWPTAKQWTLLIVNGLIGTVFSEFLWLWGCFMTSSLIATLSLSLVIPMTMAADMLLKNVHYNSLFFFGCIPIFLAFFATSLLAHYENWDPVLECLKRLLQFVCHRKKPPRLWDVDSEQTESLIGINTNEEHDA